MNNQHTQTAQLKQIDLITILAPNGTPAFGPDQEWFPEERGRISGCGPTAAAIMSAYLAWTRPDTLSALYEEASRAGNDFVEHMRKLFSIVTPGPMGLNSLAMFEHGIRAFLDKRAISLQTVAFQVNGIDYRCRDREDELRTFVFDALNEDQPIAFLALSRGKEKALQNWHWITIVAAELRDGDVFATATDEGKARTFNLSLWYRSTKLSGGLIRLKE